LKGFVFAIVVMIFTSCEIKKLLLAALDDLSVSGMLL